MDAAGLGRHVFELGREAPVGEHHPQQERAGVSSSDLVNNRSGATVAAESIGRFPAKKTWMTMKIDATK